MNGLRIDARQIHDTTEPRSFSCVEITVDGDPLVIYAHDNLGIDLVELLKTLKGDGEFFIVTCACGDPGCAGINEGIKVSRNSDGVHWSIRNLGNGNLVSRELFFDPKEYEQVIWQAAKEFKRLRNENPGTDTIPYLLKDRLPAMSDWNDTA